MKLFHGTLNLMSLGGLAIAIGLVIDDAIIVVEAVARRLEHGEPPAQAAAGGATDLAPAVLGTTITTVIVFVPLPFELLEAAARVVRRPAPLDRRLVHRRYTALRARRAAISSRA